MTNTVHIVTDLGFGDAGKGTMVDALARKTGSKLVVRHSGGPQAAHNVVELGGRHHTFAQFGSASLLPGVHTHLSKHMLINPLNLFKEAEHLRSLGLGDPFKRLSIHEDALIITPFHMAANQIREQARGDSRHGSCGQGVAEAQSDWINYGIGLRAWEFRKGENYLLKKLCEIIALKRDQIEDAGLEWINKFGITEVCVDAYRDLFRLCGFGDDECFAEELHYEQEPVIFEGAQGVLLDEWHGFHPYTTWSTTTHKNAIEMLVDADYQGDIDHIGVMRSYQTRHGPGPFPTECRDLKIKETHNTFNEWQRQWRCGFTDLMLTGYALDVMAGCVDRLAITHMDSIESLPFWPVGYAYLHNGNPMEKLPVSAKEEVQPELTKMVGNSDPIYDVIGPKELPEYVGAYCELPVGVLSYGPTAADKIWIN